MRRSISPHKSISQSRRSDSKSNCPAKQWGSELTNQQNGPRGFTVCLSEIPSAFSNSDQMVPPPKESRKKNTNNPTQDFATASESFHGRMSGTGAVGEGNGEGIDGTSPRRSPPKPPADPAGRMPWAAATLAAQGHGGCGAARAPAPPRGRFCPSTQAP